MKYRPKLNPKVDLKGATPEKLARALLRNRNLRPVRKRKDEERSDAHPQRDETDDR